MLLQKRKKIQIYIHIYVCIQAYQNALSRLWFIKNKTVSSLFPQFVSASSKVGCHSGCSLPHPNGLHSRYAEQSSLNQTLILLTFLAKLLERNSSWQLQCLCSLVYQAAAEWTGQAHHFCAAAENRDKGQAGSGKAPSFPNILGRRGEKQRFEKKDSLQEPRQVTATCAAVVGTSFPFAVRFGGRISSF